MDDVDWESDPAYAKVPCVEVHLDAATVTASKTTARTPPATVEEFHASIEHNRSFTLHYGDRYPRDQRIRTGFVESTLNQEAKVLLEELS